jgi:hypothetical protein
MKNLKNQESKPIRLVLIAIFTLFLIPIQTTASKASIGDFTITSTAGTFPNFSATFGTAETLSVTVDIAGSALTMDSFTATSTINDLTIVRTNDAYDGVFDILLPSNIDSGTYTVDLLWESDVPESSTTTVNLTVSAIAPDAPTALTATPGDGSASISFTSGSTGGSPITDYLYSVDSGTWTSASASTSPVTITGLTNGTLYSIELRAVNIVDSGTISSAVTVTPAAPAPAPAPAPVYIPTTPQAALTLSSSATTVEWGTQAKLTLTGGSGTGAVTYSSTGTTFCAVNPSGNLTPVSAGTCTVTATKDGDGTYGSAQSNSVTITAVEKLGASATTGSTSNAGVAMVVGKPVAGVATVKFTVADTYAGEKVSVILATKNSAGKTIYKTLGSAKVGSTGAVSFKTKVKLPVGAVLQLKSAGSVILSKSIK